MEDWAGGRRILGRGEAKSVYAIVTLRTERKMKAPPCVHSAYVAFHIDSPIAKREMPATTRKGVARAVNANAAGEESNLQVSLEITIAKS